MKEEKGFFERPDGSKRYFHFFEAESEKAGILLIHGLGEHVLRYRDVAERLTNAGFSVYGFDLPGHGQSDGKRGHINRFQDFVREVEGFRNFLGEKHRKTHFVFGHSLGGLIAFHFGLAVSVDAFRGFVLSSPGLKVRMAVPGWKVALGKFFSNVWPGFTQNSDLPPEAISTQPEEVEKYRNDPLVHSKISARFYVEMTAAMEAVFQKAGEFTHPVLIIQGEADPIVDPAGARQLFNIIGSADKAIKLYPNAYHEVFHDVERDRAFSDLIAWLSAY